MIKLLKGMGLVIAAPFGVVAFLIAVALLAFHDPRDYLPPLGRDAR